jgi:uncharacterized tellurite resistance protein B-like protein
MSDRFEHIANLLMGAAHADDDLDGRELDTVRKLLTDAMGEDELPHGIEAKLHLFDPEEHDIQATVDAIDLGDDDMKLKLVELMVAVQNSDEIVDYNEDEYIIEVAKAMGLPEEKYKSLTLDIQLEEAGKVLKPPPLPTKD